jgi:hypothetical protein
MGGDDDELLHHTRKSRGLVGTAIAETIAGPHD